MKYVIRATKNTCGDVEGFANMGPGTELPNWTTSKTQQPHRGMEINKVFKLFEYYHDHNIRNDNCKCKFNIEAWDIK